MTAAKIYQNAPIVLVSFEIELQTLGPIEQEIFAQIGVILKDTLPERFEMKGHHFAFDPSKEKEPNFEELTSPRWSSRDRRTHCSIFSSPINPPGTFETSCVFETTNYKGYQSLRELTSKVMAIVFTSSKVQKVNRMGIRYLDEIRAPLDAEGTVKWSDWVAKSLLQELPELSRLLLENGVRQTAVAYQIGSDAFLRLRYGASEGYEFSGSENFKRLTPNPGPYFLLDIAVDQNVQRQLAESAMLDLMDEMHKPVREVFESLITEKLRKEVLENGS
ncbi:TIGR04255 family protein [Corynebacterium kalinowskii]|nr:TIGR04255 family protein [Corynebacterium kalinowskii]